MDLNTSDYGGFVDQASQMLRQKLQLPQGYTYQWSGEYEFQLRAKERMKIILPVVFFVIFLLLYVIFHNLTEAHGPDLSHVLSDDRRADLAVAAGLQLQRCGVGWDIALLGIAVETVVMVVYLLESLDRRIALDRPLTETDIHEAAIEGAVQRLRSKLMTVCAVLARPDSNPMGASAPT